MYTYIFEYTYIHTYIYIYISRVSHTPNKLLDTELSIPMQESVLPGKTLLAHDTWDLQGIWIAVFFIFLRNIVEQIHFYLGFI